MNIINLKQKRQVELDNEVRIAYGVDAVRDLQDTAEHDVYIYSASLSLLKMPGRNKHSVEEILLPPKSVVVLDHNIVSELFVTPEEENLRTIAFTAPYSWALSREEDALLEKPYALSDRELNSEIKSFKYATLFTDASRYLPFLIPKGKAIKSGWYTHAFKDCPLSISDAEWTEVRNDEIMHYHQVLSEMYVIMEGAAVMSVEGEALVVPAGHLAVTELGEAHKIGGVKLSKNGLYRHLCAQYPGITQDKGERVNVDTKDGFDLDKLLDE